MTFLETRLDPNTIIHSARRHGQELKDTSAVYPLYRDCTYALVQTRLFHATMAAYSGMTLVQHVGIGY
jgi:hypothetical protein